MPINPTSPEAEILIRIKYNTIQKAELSPGTIGHTFATHRPNESITSLSTRCDLAAVIPVPHFKASHDEPLAAV